MKITEIERKIQELIETELPTYEEIEKLKNKLIENPIIYDNFSVYILDYGNKFGDYIISVTDKTTRNDFIIEVIGNKKAYAFKHGGAVLLSHFDGKFIYSYDIAIKLLKAIENIRKNIN